MTLFADAPHGETMALVALTLAVYGDAVASRLGETVPQATWDWLTDRGLIDHGRDITGEGTCEATREGRDVLLAHIEAMSGA